MAKKEKRSKRKSEEVEDFEEDLDIEPDPYSRKPPDDLNFEALEKRIMDVDDLPTTITALIYGEIGIGKTTLLSTFPKPIVLDCREKGTSSIRHTGAKVVRIRSWDELVEYYWYLKLANHPYKTVGIDSATQAADLAMTKVLEMDEYAGLPVTKHWGQMTQLVKPQFLDFRDLSDKMNIVFNCQLRRQDEEDMNNKMPFSLIPALSPSVSKSIGGAVDVVGYLHIKERKVKVPGSKKTKTVTERLLRVKPHPDILAKIRVPRGVEAPTIIKDPTYQKLYEIMIEGKVGKA